MTVPLPIWDKRALVCGSALVVADIHMGYESELAGKGFEVPSQTSNMILEILELLKETGSETLVINGDLKHNIPRGSWQEYREIPRAMDIWLKEVNHIHISKGNHDGGIERYLPSDVNIHGPGGFVIDDTGFFHGHAKPCREVTNTCIKIVAHSHPVVTLYDRLGKMERYPCWVKLKYRLEDNLEQAIVMPNYNRLLGGASINEKGYLGPYFRHADILEERVYLLDGTCLGEVPRNHDKLP